MCVAEHGTPPHSLVYILDYARDILKVQLAERLAAVKASKSSLPAPPAEEVSVWIASLDNFLTSTTKELEKLKTAQYRLQDYSRSLQSKEAHPDLETRMQDLAATIEKFNKDTSPQAVIDASVRFEKLSEVMRLHESGKSESLFPGESIHTLTHHSTPELIRTTSATITHFLNCLGPHYSCIARFSNERYDSSYDFLWTLTNDSHTAEKTLRPEIITICGVDADMKEGEYEIVYRIDSYTSEDSCDSLGIAPKSSFSTNAFNSGNMFGLFNGRITSNNASNNVDYRFKQGDMIKIVYSSYKHTLEFWANSIQLGPTIANVPANTYRTGIAFRKAGVKITLLSFHYI